MSRLENLKKYLKIEDDGELFYHKINKPNEFDHNLDNIIKYYSNEIKNLSYLQNEISNSSFENDNEKDSIIKTISQIEYSLSDVENVLESAKIAIQDLEENADNWKNVAMELFEYMLNNHANELNDTSILNYNIDENEMKSIMSINKFNL